MKDLSTTEPYMPTTPAEADPKPAKSIDELVNDYNNELKARKNFPRAVRRDLVQQFRKALQKRIPK